MNNRYFWDLKLITYRYFAFCHPVIVKFSIHPVYSSKKILLNLVWKNLHINQHLKPYTSSILYFYFSSPLAICSTVSPLQNFHFYYYPLYLYSCSRIFLNNSCSISPFRYTVTTSIW